MNVGFFYDARFQRDPSGRYFGYGALPYGAFARYLRHFDRVFVVGRLEETETPRGSAASGPGVEMACFARASPLALSFGRDVRRHVRAVMARVDCAIIRTPSFVAGIAASEAIRAGKPWMVEVVGSALGTLWHHGSLAGKLAALPVHLRNRGTIRAAPYALYVSREFLQRCYPSRGVSVACANVAIEAPRRDVLERRLARIGAASGAGVPAPVLGLVGSLDVRYKGHETALRALARLRRAGLAPRLRLLGAGDPAPWRARAERLGVADAVELCGTLPSGAPVLEWMDTLDLFLLPSLTEGLPRALVEAMSRAVPALGARVGGVPELVAPDCVHAPGDHRALAGLVERLARDPAALARNARRNWEAADAYRADLLEARRDAFLRAFKEAALATNGRLAPAIR